MPTVLEPYMPYIVPALITLAIVLIGWIIVRSFSKNIRGKKGARLGLMEYYEIDKTRRLVIVRRDDVEHLIMIGGPQDMVIETNIPNGLGSFAERKDPAIMAREAAAFHAALPLKPPRPPVFGERRPALRPVDNVTSFRDDDQAS